MEENSRSPSIPSHCIYSISLHSSVSRAKWTRSNWSLLLLRGRSAEEIEIVLILLTAFSEAQHQMQCALLLNVVIRQRATIFKLLACKNQPLLIWWNAFLVLNLSLDIVNGVTCLHIQSDGLASQSLHKDLHASTKTQDQMQCALFLDVVVRQRATILQLLARKDQALLIRGNAFLVLNLSLDIVDGITC